MLTSLWKLFVYDVTTLQGLFRRLASQNSRLVLYINAVDPHLWTIYRPYTHALYRRNGSKLCDTETTIVPACTPKVSTKTLHDPQQSA